ncbi:hypothetical protein IKD98_04325 [Candidatus Saccharibacteria bacterium]|nr:hypothetical protein [Candidatus Saccharibacteria bacterium]
MESNNIPVSETPESEAPDATTTISTESAESSKSAPRPEPKPVKSSKALIWCLAIIATISIVAAAVFAYLYFTTPTTPAPTPNNNQSTTSDKPATTEENNKYKLSDYATFSEISVPVTFPDEVEKGHTQDTLTKIELTNLPQTIITKYNDAQEQLINNEDIYIISRSNKANTTINGDILSIYTIFKYDSVYSDYGKAETLNYNLNTKQELSNQELEKVYNLTDEEIYSKVLEQLVDNVTTSSFLLNTDGDVSAPTISLADFSNKIPEYAKTLSSNTDLVKLYVDKDNKVHALYEQSQILKSLGMSTHMGGGLLPSIQDVSL